MQAENSFEAARVPEVARYSIFLEILLGFRVQNWFSITLRPVSDDILAYPNLVLPMVSRLTLQALAHSGSDQICRFEQLSRAPVYC